jgi:hypothetical protein
MRPASAGKPRRGIAASWRPRGCPRSGAATPSTGCHSSSPIGIDRGLRPPLQRWWLWLCTAPTMLEIMNCASRVGWFRDFEAFADGTNYPRKNRWDERYRADWSLSAPSMKQGVVGVNLGTMPYPPPSQERRCYEWLPEDFWVHASASATSCTFLTNQGCLMVFRAPLNLSGFAKIAFESTTEPCEPVDQKRSQLPGV